jgi:hypothetical protein
MNLCYKIIKLIDEFVINSSKIGLGKNIKNLNILIFYEEKLMLNQVLCQPNSSIGVN